ncbi:hypothetical protein DEU56DRAFT_803327 [Suillus clintonianus]|uniref:uncharacterized protein n=1 Tax=Suillus clintonianus TaxID=1904413 RepID=UPI001B87392C|nr:uncharacterized protein DEU56DRAFT_803327 [Suillus clintonianus]KAG2137959.1 hypothetical protein DEU56DRAFT_803327 [Suillus clintonianus]
MQKNRQGNVIFCRCAVRCVSGNSTTPKAAVWDTNHNVIEQTYKEAGYELPEIVYWDLSTAYHYPGITAPVISERRGVGLLNGYTYSPSLLKVFMDRAKEEK